MHWGRAPLSLLRLLRLLRLQDALNICLSRKRIAFAGLGIQAVAAPSNDDLAGWSGPAPFGRSLEAERIGRRSPGSNREAVARAARERSEQERASNVFRRIHFTYLRALLASYLELHIKQSPVPEASGSSLELAGTAE